MVMKAKQETGHAQHEAAKPANPAKPAGAAMHEATLTAEEFALLNGLEQQVGDVHQVRSDMAELLMDDETTALLQQYRPFFEMGDVTVDGAIEALPLAMRLHRLERRLAAAQELVHRHYLSAAAPVAEAASNVRRMVVSTPEGSTIRAAFSLLDARWQKTFRGGGAPAKSASPDATAPSKPDPR